MNGADFAVNVGGAIGDYSFNIHGIGNDSFHIAHDAAVVLHVVDFAIGAASPGSVSVAQGNSTTATFGVSASGSFGGTVNLACSGLPAGVTCSFTPASAQPVSGSPVSVTLTMSASATTTTGTSSVSIVATTSGAPAAKTQPISLTVSPFSFSVGNTTDSQTLKAGQAATYTITLTPLQGFPFPNSIQFACDASDLAATVAQCSFSPAQVAAGATGIQSITLTISTAGPTAQGHRERAISRDHTRTLCGCRS